MGFPTGCRVEALEARVLFAIVVPGPEATPTIYTAVGAGNVATAIADFQAAVGGSNNGPMFGDQSGGFRQVAWDGVSFGGADAGGATQTLDSGDAVAVPADRFQARGIVFNAPVAVSNDGFNELNAAAGSLIHAYSPNNAAAPINTTLITASLVEPSPRDSQSLPQATSAVGIVFLNVETPQASYIKLFNGSNKIAKIYAPTGDSGQIEFVGIVYGAPVVTSFTVNAGTSPIFTDAAGVISTGPDDIFQGGTNNLVGIDNVDYAEPTTPANSIVIAPAATQSFNLRVAKFTSTDPSAQASDFTADIDWGDGSDSAGTIIAAPNGVGFRVRGTHSYAASGLYTISTNIADTSNGDTATVQTTADVQAGATPAIAVQNGSATTAIAAATSPGTPWTDGVESSLTTNGAGNAAGITSTDQQLLAADVNPLSSSN